MDESIVNSADYVIVGAGSAGCVLAARLSEDPDIKVVLIEAGGRDRNMWLHIPVGFSKTIGDTRFDWSFQAGPEPGLDGRMIHYARGKTLGGSSAINGLAWVHGGRRDYDGWVDKGCDRWGYEDILPYLKKVEAFPQGGPERGKDGPVRVQLNPGWADSMERLVETCAAMGIPRTDDYNCEFPFGVGRLQTNVSGGRRMSASSTYLAGARHRPNLAVVTDAEVDGLLIENGAAIGVRMLRAGHTRTFLAGREVILSAGAVGSPVILEKSGIGHPDRLMSLGIAVRGAAPEVGENAKDHFITAFRLSVRGLDSVNGSDSGVRAAIAALRYLFARTGTLVETPTQLTGFARTQAGHGPPDIQLFAMPLTYSFQNVAGRFKAVMEKDPGMSVSFYAIHPKSKGAVHLQPNGSLSIVTGVLTDADDQRIYVDAMRFMRRLIAYRPLAGHIVAETAPGPTVEDSFDDLLGYAKRGGGCGYHLVSTCRMGSDDTSVVDQQLQVRACRRLRVVDASVMPDIIGSNTNAPTMAIAERAADFILTKRA